MSIAQDPPILLLIDLQHGLVEGPSAWGPRSTPKLAENVTYLLDIWRSKLWPVLHVHHDDTADPSNPISASHPETFAPHSCSKPLDSEPVFIKHVGSPFVATGLPAAIEALGGKRKIALIGMDGSECVNNTTRNGVDLGYDIVVVGDACSSYAMNDWKTGKPFEAEETHNAAMSMLCSYAKVTMTKELLAVLGFE
jgi:nicotinamidase-related amidase